MNYAVKTLGVMVISYAAFACNPSHKPDEATKITYVHVDSSKQEHVDSSASLITGTLTSKSGDNLRYSFDNSMHTMTIVYKDDLSVLQQDTMASGIKYSNKTYTYSEFHGAAAVQKNGRTVFEAITAH